MTFKKILAVLVMAMCVLGIALALAGILGSWVLNRMVASRSDAFLQRAAASLGGLESGLNQAESGLSTTSEALQGLEEIPLIGGLVRPLMENVGGLTIQVEDMHTQVNELQGMVGVLQANLHLWLNLGTLAITVMLLWFGASQVSLFYHGLDWYRQAEDTDKPPGEENTIVISESKE
jgi:hypothetical protein